MDQKHYFGNTYVDRINVDRVDRISWVAILMKCKLHKHILEIMNRESALATLAQLD